MSQHSERTQFGPSLASVAAGAVLVVASAVATGYMIADLSLDLRDALGFVFGVGLTGLLAVHVLGMVGERAVVRDRAERAAERERRETSETHAELNAWQNATAALLDAYLTGRAVDFGGEPVPGYVRTRLADAVPVAPPTYPEPHPEPPYEPARTPGSWNAFEPASARRAALERVPMPLPPRDGYVDPGPYSSFVPVSPGRTTGGYELDCDGRCGDEGCPAYVDRRDYAGSWSGADIASCATQTTATSTSDRSVQAHVRWRYCGACTQNCGYESTKTKAQWHGCGIASFSATASG